jgi:hypothetical protein
MSNASWVCFDCRTTVRRPTFRRTVVLCPECRQRCFCLGRKIPVPPKANIAAWNKLRQAMQTLTADWQVRSEKSAVARRHEIERQLVALESKPAEPSRARQIKKLREELAGG